MNQIYTGTFNLGDYNLYKGLLLNPYGELETTGNTTRRARKKTRIIVTYAITNTVTGMSYVGSTEMFFARWQGHLNALRNGRHTNNLLQEEYNRSSEEDYNITVLRSFETTLDLAKEEEHDGRTLFDLDDLHNYRIGMTFIKTPEIHNGKKYIGKNKWKIQKARWFDGTAEPRIR